MVLKWVNSVVRSTSKEAIQQGANEETKKIRRIEGRDIAHEAMKLRARQRSEELGGLVAKGMPQVRREKFKSIVKKQVFEIVSETYRLKRGGALDEVTEEITDQIVNAADADPYYQEIFDEERGE